MERGGNQVFIAFCGHTHSVLEWEASGALFTSDWALHYTSLLLLLLLLLLFVCPG
jgi:hypothetical protein